MQLLKLIFGVWLTVFSCEMKICNSYHIVFHQIAISQSHLIATWNFTEALLAKGHNVTYLTYLNLPAENPLVDQVKPQSVAEYFDKALGANFDVNTRLDGLIQPLQLSLEQLNLDSCELFLKSEELHAWLKTSPKVDLIYIDNFPECGFGLQHKLKSKLAIFSTLPLLPKYFENFGVPVESSAVTSMDMPYKRPLSLYERIMGTLSPFAWRLSQYHTWYHIRRSTEMHLDLPDLPPLVELLKKISLVLSNGHFLEEQRRSLPPFFVSVPGLHIKETHDALPMDLETFINSRGPSGNSIEGFVYISLGTLAKAPKLPQKIRQVFYNSMKALPEIKFLWKWDGEFPTDIPQNLKLQKWFNQQDILGHPKIKGFITQAGRPSTQEAMFNAVPMISFPILIDQDYNANVAENLGISIKLEITDVTEEELTNAIRKIVYDSKLAARSKEIAKIFKDVPMKPVDTAVWWTEYILRHNDTSHLLPLAIDQMWYERRLLDVWAFIASIVLILTFISYIMTCFIVKLILNATESMGGKKLKMN